MTNETTKQNRVCDNCPFRHVLSRMTFPEAANVTDETFDMLTEAEEAEICLEQSYHVLHDFSDRWFSDREPTESTLRDMQYRYNLLQAHLWVILTGLGCAWEHLQKIINRGGKKHDNGNVVGQ